MPENSKPTATSFSVDCKIVIDPKTVGNVFNGYFTSNGLKVAGSLPPAAHLPHMPHQISQHFTLPLSLQTKYIEKQLQNLAENKAVGLDRLPCKLIFIAASSYPIHSPLLYIYDCNLVNLFQNESMQMCCHFLSMAH